MGAASRRHHLKRHHSILYVYSVMAIMIAGGLLNVRYNGNPMSPLPRWDDNNSIVALARSYVDKNTSNDTTSVNQHDDDVKLSGPRENDTLRTPQLSAVDSESIRRTLQAPSLKKRLYQPSDFANLTLLTFGDPIFEYGGYDEAPIVIPQHKLLFFTLPKVGCTVFKQLFRRVMNLKDWKVHNDVLPHVPGINGLYYLYHYTPADADYMLTDPSWTRAVFVRDPIERILSAYLDKAMDQNGVYLQNHCCPVAVKLALQKKTEGHTAYHLLSCQKHLAQQRNPVKTNFGKQALVSFDDFVQKVMPICSDPHWRSQKQRMGPLYWDHINFVGHMENIANDTERLLTQLGMWEQYGASGWGSNPRNDGENTSVFAGLSTVKHATGSGSRLDQYLKTIDLKATLLQLTREDYDFGSLDLASPGNRIFDAKTSR
jgi:hypothetical protein